MFRGDFLVRKIALPHIDLSWSRHLAVSNDRLPDPVSRITPDAWNELYAPELGLSNVALVMP